MDLAGDGDGYESVTWSKGSAVSEKKLYLFCFHFTFFASKLFFTFISLKNHFLKISFPPIPENGKSEKNAAKEEDLPKMNPENHRFPNINNRADSSS